jgi:ribonuclease BN (tRNA processing enzyme)
MLIHEAYDQDWLAEHIPMLAAIFEHNHSTTAEAARTANSAGAQHLVLNHLIPADPRLVPDGRWAELAQKHYTGPVTVGSDLLQLTV